MMASAAAVALSLSALIASGVVPVAREAPVASSSVGAGNARAEQIASTSKPTKDALTLVEKAARGIHDAKLRAAVLDVLAHPAPTFLAPWKDRNEARQALVDGGFLESKVSVDDLFPSSPALSFRGASGGIIGKHHGHPGGLAMHTAVNLQTSRALAAEYKARYQVKLDDDVLVASAVLHDAMKAYTLQFFEDGTLTAQPMLAGTSSHHPFIVAEAMHRGVRDDVILALAAAHEPPAMPDGNAKVAAFIKAAAVLAKKDPAPLLAMLAVPRLEASVNHLGDHDYVLADPAYAAVDQALDDAGITDRWKKHETLARVSGMTLYAALAGSGGLDAMKKLLP